MHPVVSHHATLLLLAAVWFPLILVAGGALPVCLSCSGSNNDNCKGSPAFVDDNALTPCFEYNDELYKIGKAAETDPSKMAEADPIVLRMKEKLVNVANRAVQAMIDAQKEKNPSWKGPKQPFTFPGYDGWEKKCGGVIGMVILMQWPEIMARAISQRLTEEKMLDGSKLMMDAVEKQFMGMGICTRRRRRGAIDSKYPELVDKDNMDGWCMTTEINGDFKRGCGVHVEGMTFEPGCHNVTEGKYKGLRYCRCDGDQCNDMPNKKKKKGGIGGRPIGGRDKMEGMGDEGIRGRGSVWLVAAGVAMLGLVGQ